LQLNDLRSRQREVRLGIVTELGMPVQAAFDALLIMKLGRLPSWFVCGYFDLCPSFLPYGV